jgi:restriction system protein
MWENVFDSDYKDTEKVDYLLKPILEIVCTQGKVRRKSLIHQLLKRLGVNDANKKDKFGNQTWNYLRIALNRLGLHGLIQKGGSDSEIIFSATTQGIKCLEEYSGKEIIDQSSLKTAYPEMNQDTSEQDANEQQNDENEYENTKFGSELISLILKENEGKPNNGKDFETIVLLLLKAMGYCKWMDGTDIPFEHIGSLYDEGIDGIIYLDPLKLEILAVQAKAWNTETKNGVSQDIPQKDIRNFIGSMDAVGANKGVFLTTSYFTSPATDFAKKMEPRKRVALIDRYMLIELFSKHQKSISNDLQELIPWLYSKLTSLPANNK